MELDQWPKITLFGDSITRYSMDPNNGNWASHLAHQLLSYYQIDVKGFSGYTSKWALELVPKLFTKKYLQNVDLFVLFFGHNDAWQTPEFPGVELEQYETNMAQIINLLMHNGLSKDKIILITPGWYDQPTFTQFRFNERKSDLVKNLEHSRRYAEAALRVANDNQVSYVDWWSITRAYEPFAELFNDGLHLSQIGAKVLFEAIWPVTKNKLESLHNKPVSELTMVEIPDALTEARRKSSMAQLSIDD